VSVVTSPTSQAVRLKRPLSGMLLLDKAQGATSNAALQSVKHLLGAIKAGHTGTLDPMATGLLPLLFGQATRLASFLSDADKRYLATIRLGQRTDSGDVTGRVLEEKPVHVSPHEVEAVLSRFLGEIQQIPPMHSAVRVDGRRLYQLAHRGETIERAPRTVRIDLLRLVAFEGREYVLDVKCGKGTYIRALAEDIGAALGCVATLAALRRTAAAGFHVDSAVTESALRGMSQVERESMLLPTDRPVQGLAEVMLPPSESGRFLHGQSVRPRPGELFEQTGLVRIYDGGSHRFLGLATASAELIVPHLVLARTDGA